MLLKVLGIVGGILLLSSCASVGGVSHPASSRIVEEDPPHIVEEAKDAIAWYHERSGTPMVDVPKIVIVDEPDLRGSYLCRGNKEDRILKLSVAPPGPDYRNAVGQYIIAHEVYHHLQCVMGTKLKETDAEVQAGRYVRATKRDTS